MIRVPQKQKGAALIVVLLMTATLSFIVLALVSKMTQSAQRTAGVTLRNELLWRVVSAEVVAKEAIRQALAQAAEAGPALSLNHPLFSQQLDIPFPDRNGEGAMIFADATRCLNVNAVIAQSGSDQNANNAESEDTTNSLAALIIALGGNEGEATTLSAAIKDFIDPDTLQEIGGAEDDFYTDLPTPFRTAGGPIAHVSELRAIKGISPEFMGLVSPYLCAMPARDNVAINVNTLRPIDAPLLVAITAGTLDINDAERIISDRPPGGWTTTEQFLALPVFDNDGIDSQKLGSQVAVTSRYIEAIAGASVNEIDMNVRLVFDASANGSDISLIRREIGAPR